MVHCDAPAAANDKCVAPAECPALIEYGSSAWRNAYKSCKNCAELSCLADVVGVHFDGAAHLGTDEVGCILAILSAGHVHQLTGNA